MASLGNRAKNARLQASRRITELGVQYRAATTELSHEQILSKMNDIKAAITETRTFSGRKLTSSTIAQREAAVVRLEDINRAFEMPDTPSVRGSNSVFIRNMKSASRGEPTQEISQNAVHAFMRATQEAWQGKGEVRDRYNAMKTYYGTTDLQLIYDAVYYENKKKITVLNKVKAGERLTLEEKQMMQEMRREDDDLEKRYRKNDEESPLVGMVARNIPYMTRDRFEEIINSEEFYKAIANNFEESD